MHQRPCREAELAALREQQAAAGPSTEARAGTGGGAQQRRPPQRLIQISWVAGLYMLGIVPLELYASWLHTLLDGQDNMPFLPRLLVSVYCALGVCGLYFWADWPFATQHNAEVHAKAA